MNPQLRKAAIVLKSLDKEAAAKLLAQMPAPIAKKVLAFAKELGPIDSIEQQEVMRDFMTKKASSPPASQEAGSSEVSLELSAEAAIAPLASRAPAEKLTETPSPSSAPLSATRFAFVTSELVEPLASVLSREQPQLAALILAHLLPERSAAVLALFDAESRLATIQRIAEIEESATEVLDEIEQELKSRLTREQFKLDGSKQGLAALSSILQASDPELRTQISTAIGGRMAKQAAHVACAISAPVTQEPEAADAEEKIATETHSAGEQTLPSISFGALSELDDISLAAVFGSVSPQVAILALVGAEETLVKRILRVLPRKEAMAFRRKLEEVGPLRLKEVELAQKQMSHAAGDLARQRRITIPVSQPLSKRAGLAA
jgi:flagellar motor switch protein FliG